MSLLQKPTNRNPAVCIRCQPAWRRWVRNRSRQLGVNESTLVEMACAWYAQDRGFSLLSPPLWIPEASTRWVDPHDADRYKDEALYLNVTPTWRTWVHQFAASEHLSLAWAVERALHAYAQAQGVPLPPMRTRHFTHVIR
jgi:hypothetical protein